MNDQTTDSFLAAWKRGVKLAGAHFFVAQRGLTAPPSPDDAVSKWQLVPNWEYVEDNIRALSRGEAVFLAAMCAFYNDEWGRGLLHDDADPCSIAAILDSERRQVIADLLVSYRGW